MEIYEDQIVIPLAAYTATQSSPDVRAHGAGGLYVLLHVTAAGTGTLALRVLGKEPFEGNYYALNVDVTVTGATRHNWVFGPGVARQPAGEGASTVDPGVRQTVGIPIPDVFRVDVVKSDASAWTFGVSIKREPG